MAKGKLLIGLTGGIGSGKSAAANIFAELGITVVDADVAARKVVEPGQDALKAIVRHFGDSVLLPDEAGLDRQKLRSIIFSNPDERRWLNNLLHPLIRDWMDKQVAGAESPYVIKVIPLLFESGQQHQFDRILVIDVTEETQLRRVSLRDKSSQEEVMKIIRSQASRAKRLAECHDVISNDSTLADLEKAVKKMHNKYLEIAAQF